MVRVGVGLGYERPQIFINKPSVLHLLPSETHFYYSPVIPPLPKRLIHGSLGRSEGCKLSDGLGLGG